LVDIGKLECTKVFKKGEEAKHLKFYGPGEAFGELALLYNAPRAASI
jgi:cAMP-dependent protein kinase regulator